MTIRRSRELTDAEKEQLAKFSKKLSDALLPMSGATGLHGTIARLTESATGLRDVGTITDDPDTLAKAAGMDFLAEQLKATGQESKPAAWAVGPPMFNHKHHIRQCVGGEWHVSSPGFGGVVVGRTYDEALVIVKHRDDLLDRKGNQSRSRGEHYSI